MSRAFAAVREVADLIGVALVSFFSAIVRPTKQVWPIVVGSVVLLLFLFLARAYQFTDVAPGAFTSPGARWTLGDDGRITVIAAPPEEAIKHDGEDDGTTKESRTVPISRTQFQLEEFGARTMWMASNFAMVYLIIALASKCLRVLIAQRPKTFWCWLLVPVALGLVVFVSVTWITFPGVELQIVSKLQSDALAVRPLSAIAQLDEIENLLVLVLSFLFAAASGVLSTEGEKNSQTAEQFRQRLRDMHELLNLGAFFLVAGVFHLWTQWNWPITFLADADDRHFARLFVNSLTFCVGTMFTALLGGVYFSAMFQLSEATSDFIRQGLEAKGIVVTKERLRETLAKNGFEHSTMFDVSALIKVLSPVIAAGPISAILQFVYSA